MSEALPTGVEITAAVTDDARRILTTEALELVAGLQRELGSRRQELLERRRERRAALAGGTALDYLPETAAIREGDWQVAPAPTDLLDRRVEITGPAEPKMLINALNSGARVFMADIEDALSPTWANVLGAQTTLLDAARRKVDFTSPEGKRYALHKETATLLVRPRGWHLDQAHVTIDGEPVSASLFDFGLHLANAGRAALERGAGPCLGPYYYLPKLESHLEARLWNDAFVFAQEALGIPVGTIRATVLIETIWAAFEMEEILHELRDHAAGLNAGRWDYIFSLIKAYRERPDMVLPDRGQVTMAVPFMRAYTQALVRACHRRGAHAIGGMSAFIPNRREPEVTAVALQKVREDKEREAGDGFDGTWVAHPDLVPVALEVFDAALGDRPNQKERLREDALATAAALTDPSVPGGAISEAGVRMNISVALQYLDNWLRGNGAAAINNLMEDVATAEISRSQLWQWRVNASRLADTDGEVVDVALMHRLMADELARLGGHDEGRLGTAAELLYGLVMSNDFA
ncbi:MAG TPA: malate synthase A, partial [Candidatus Limnocylindrales bacterium]|nr:malate synthase A [Candidatus Limnocylindrales bacterium]